VKSLGWGSYIESKLSGYVRAQTKVVRMFACKMCTERETVSGKPAGPRLFREIAGKPYCGEPRGIIDRRIEANVGCGCNLEDKTRWKASVCPRMRWAAEGEQHTGVVGTVSVLNEQGKPGNVRINVPRDMRLDVKPRILLNRTSNGTALSSARLVRLDANGIGDLCVAACVAAGVSRKTPGAPVALAVRPHLLPWASHFKDAAFVLSTEGLDDSTFGWACYPDKGKTQFEFPTRGALGWVTHACKACDAEFALPKIEILDAALGWVNEQEAFRVQPLTVLAPYAIYGSRNWPLHRWLELERLLGQAGHRVVVVDGPGDGSKLSMFRSPRYWGLAADKVFALVQRAALVVACDSGLAHLAGVLQRPAIALLGPTNGPSTFEKYGTVRWIHGHTDCQGCYWSRPHGFRDECLTNCDALWSIRAGEVLELVGGVLSVR
jgi:hypothetical protein